MAKRVIDKEQFFTTDDLAKRSVDFTDSIVKLSSFDLIVEPSAGAGNFLDLLPEDKRVGIDLDPKRDDLIESDFLKWYPEFSFEERRILTIGNPPFGQRGAMAIEFINHASRFSDVIAFILPRSFNKDTFQNRIPAYFHLHDSFLCDEFYLPDGTDANVKAIFQVWERESTKRQHVTMPSVHKDFSMKHAHLSRVTAEQKEVLLAEYDIAVAQVGANFSPREVDAVISRGQGSFWFLKSHIGKSVLGDRLSNCDYGFLADMNTAHTSLSKRDIIRAYQLVVDTEGNRDLAETG